MTGFVVLLVVTIAWPDAPPWREETPQPDITTCMVRAAHVLEQARGVHSDDPYRVSAACVMTWPGEDPA